MDTDVIPVDTQQSVAKADLLDLDRLAEFLRLNGAMIPHQQKSDHIGNWPFPAIFGHERRKNMGWRDYYRLLEKYDGDLSRAGADELETAAKRNPNDPISARQIAEHQWQNRDESDYRCSAGQVRPLALAELEQRDKPQPGEPVQEDLFACFCSY